MTMKRMTIILVLALRGLMFAQTTAPAHLDFGSEGLVFPPVTIANGHSQRTAQLLGEAYRRNEPLVWKRVQYVADLGAVVLPAAAPYLIDAMKDPAAEVRAEAARSAARVGDASLLPEVEKLLGDSEAIVRREVVIAAATLAKKHNANTAAIDRGLADADPSIIAAAIDSAWTSQHAALIAAKIPTLKPDLQSAAATALARSKATAHAATIVPLLKGETPQRIAAANALGELADPATAPAVTELLAAAHPTVRRAAMLAIGKIADARARQSLAIRMLADPDLTVRQAAVNVLTPLASTEALERIAAQLAEDYAPLHDAVRQSLSHPADDAVRQATIARAAKMLTDPNPRRREDASFVLGALRSNAAVTDHIALLNWDATAPEKSDWPTIAQSAESLGLIGDARAIPLLEALVKPAPEASLKLQRPQRDDMDLAMANALLSLARLHHKPALADASRVLQLDPAGSPRKLRAAAAFAAGVLGDPGKSPPGFNLLGIYDSPFEDHVTKFEALKALGNLRATPAADRLKRIAESDPSADTRWIAHWAYERSANAQVPYTPPMERSQPPVTITDLTQ